MLARLGHRLLAGLAVVIGVVTLTFFLLHLAPGDPIDIILGPAATVQQRAAQRTALELDRPLSVQFVSWLSRFARGDWGNSIAKGRPVRALLGTAWRQTAWLVGLSLLLSYLTGLAIGAVQAARGRSRLDTLLSVPTVPLFPMPGYWLRPVVGLAFTYLAALLPAVGTPGLH